MLFLLISRRSLWSAFNYMTEKNWTKQAIGGVSLCHAAVTAFGLFVLAGGAVNLFWSDHCVVWFTLSTGAGTSGFLKAGDPRTDKTKS
jgi:hypothetical protein